MGITEQCHSICRDKVAFVLLTLDQYHGKNCFCLRQSSFCSTLPWHWWKWNILTWEFFKNQVKPGGPNFNPTHYGKKAGFIFQFTMRTPPHCILGSTGREEPVEFKFLGPWCDHVGLKWLGAKNLSKTVKFRRKCQNLRGFLFLGV